MCVIFIFIPKEKENFIMPVSKNYEKSLFLYIYF